MFDWSNINKHTFTEYKTFHRLLLSTVHYFPGLFISFDKNSSTDISKICRKHYTKFVE